MNNKFNILKALGIITVVGGHSGTQFFNWFPVYSFHMPLFIFISGYFFRNDSICNVFKSKFKNLVVPFLSWNLFYGILVALFLKYGLIKFGQNLSFRSLLWEPFTGSWPFVFNGPAWFIGTLFFVQLLYLFISKYTKGKLLFSGGILLVLHFAALAMAFHGWNSWFYRLGVGVERVLYCGIFYHLGYIYRNHIEKYDSFKFNKLILTIIFNGVILGIISSKITNNIHQMYFPTQKILLPLIAACSGIYFYVQLAELLRDRIKENELLSYIGQNTFAIMMHHQLFFWLFNSFLLILKSNNILTLNTFKYDQYLKNIYFRITVYNPVSDLLYLLVGVLGPILCCYCYERIKNNVKCES